MKEELEELIDSLKNWVEQQGTIAQQAYIDAPERSIEEDYQLGKSHAFSEVYDKLEEL